MPEGAQRTRAVSERQRGFRSLSDLTPIWGNKVGAPLASLLSAFRSRIFFLHQDGGGFASSSLQKFEKEVNGFLKGERGKKVWKL